MAQKLTFEERIGRMSDTALPELCIAIRDALPSIDSDHDREIELPDDLGQLLTFKRLSTTRYELITHARNTLNNSAVAKTLNAAGRRAIKIINSEVERRHPK
jgi:hypothetical protein